MHWVSESSSVRSRLAACNRKLNKGLHKVKHFFIAIGACSPVQGASHKYQGVNDMPPRSNSISQAIVNKYSNPLAPGKGEGR